VAGSKFEDRWEHFRDLVEHLLGEPGRSAPEGDVVWYPATDAYETEDAFVVRLDLAGVRREDVRVHLRERLLVVQGVRGDSLPPGPVRFHKMETAKGPFARSILLPERFAGAPAHAVYRDGVLEIALHVREPARADVPDLRIEIVEAP
jgi:HSP20 family protein